MKRGYNMSLLFDSPLDMLLFVLSFLCLANLPKRIEAIIHNNNIAQDRLLSKLSGCLVTLFSLIYTTYYLVNYGFNGSYIYFVSFSVIFMIVLLGYSQYKIRFKNAKRAFGRRIYYGLEDCSEEISELNEKYPEVTIKMSAAKSPLNVFVETNDKKEADIILDKIRNEKSIFVDLGTKKYKTLGKLYIILLSIAVMYLITLAAYHIV